jgi:hypothetical protein
MIAGGRFRKSRWRICHNLNVNFRPHLDVKNHRDENFYDGRYNRGRAPAHAYQADEIC